jgi:hypothetical protein
MAKNGNGNAAQGKLTIMYWRDIPAQVIAKAGRTNARRELSQRFQEAIDNAAMECGAHGSGDYLEGWRKSAPKHCGADLNAAADAAVTRIERDYDDDRLARLAVSEGYDDVED